MLNWIKSEFGLSEREVLKGIYENSAFLLLCWGIYFLLAVLPR